MEKELYSDESKAMVYCMEGSDCPCKTVQNKKLKNNINDLDTIYLFWVANENMFRSETKDNPLSTDT